MKNPNNDECSDTDCVGKPMWGGGFPVMNWNNYLHKGIKIGSSDSCFEIKKSGSIEGASKDCGKGKRFLCMSECTTRPICSDPPALNTASGIRLWDGKTADSGKVVR